MNNRRDTRDESCGVGDLGKHLLGRREPVNTGTSTGPVKLARNSVVHQFDCELPSPLGRMIVEGLISDKQHFAKNSTLQREGHVKK